MTILDSLILGLVQGLAEFLPVSSSGHLVILQHFMGHHNAAENIVFDIFLHLATLLAVVYVYRTSLKDIFTGKDVGEGEDKIKPAKLIGLLAISVLSTAVIFPFKDIFESLFSNIDGVRIFLLINAVALAVLPRFRKGNLGLGRLTWVGAIIIGLAQAVGAFPGISRSGSTILAGLLLGLSPREACRYSFLLAIPTILAAALIQIPEALGLGMQIQIPQVIMGSIVALISGLFAIPLLVGVVEKGKLWGFAIYCAALGLILFFFNSGFDSTPVPLTYIQ